MQHSLSKLGGLVPNQKEALTHHISSLCPFPQSTLAESFNRLPRPLLTSHAGYQHISFHYYGANSPLKGA